MMHTCGLILAVLMCRFGGTQGSHFRASSGHPGVAQSLLQTEFSLNSQDVKKKEQQAPAAETAPAPAPAKEAAAAPAEEGAAAPAKAAAPAEDAAAAPAAEAATPAPTPAGPPAWAKPGILTMHGCECAEHWAFDGFPHKGCAVAEDHLNRNISQSLCMVKDASKCKKGYPMSQLTNVTGGTGICKNATCANPTETTWDFCSKVEDISTYVTESSCHCSAIWEYESNLYHGCSRTNGSERSWCYVAETKEGCSKAQEPEGKKTRRWDYCDLPAARPAFVTRQGCHCKPTWKTGGKEYSSCVSQEEAKWPAGLADSINEGWRALAPNPQKEKKEGELGNLLGWCQVFEDKEHCQATTKAGGFLVDVCMMADEATRTDLDTTFNLCHCQPEWSLNNNTYRGCNVTKDGDETMYWCPIVEDKNKCSKSLSPKDASKTGAGRGGWNWDYCADPDKIKNTTALWRSTRFVPHESKQEIPDWYKVMQNMKD